MAEVASRPIVLRWPEEHELRAALRAAGVPRLLITDDSRSVPTDGGPLEDWVSSSAGSEEIETRTTALAHRARNGTRASPTVDDDDLLRFGDRWVALGALEARMARLLVERFGAVVRRAELTRAAWGEAVLPANRTDAAIHRFRTHAATIGLRVVTVRSRGYMLSDPAAPS